MIYSMFDIAAHLSRIARGKTTGIVFGRSVIFETNFESNRKRRRALLHKLRRTSLNLQWYRRANERTCSLSIVANVNKNPCDFFDFTIGSECKNTGETCLRRIIGDQINFISCVKKKAVKWIFNVYLSSHLVFRLCCRYFAELKMRVWWFDFE